MPRETVLSLLGYDPVILAELSVEARQSLRGAASAWLVACAILGCTAAYAAWLVLPATWPPLVVGPAVALLGLNLLRMVTAGGGCNLEDRPEDVAALCRRYRPSLVPALVFGVLAAILAQPAQTLLWPDLEHEVEAHRQALIAQHEAAAADLGTDARYYREELERAGFPVFRLQLIWQQPKRALRLTVAICLLVLLPAFWSQVLSIRSIRAYYWHRYRRARAEAVHLSSEGRAQVAALLRSWPSYDTSESEARRD